MSRSLSERIFAGGLHTTICRAVGYIGFPFRELAERLRTLVAEHGVKKVSEALSELVVHTGWRTMLNPAARKSCWGLLGPPPERWDAFYRDWQGNPTPRPPHHQTPPVIPPPAQDDFLSSLIRLVSTELEANLKLARKSGTLDDVQALESEMLRRGMDIPPAETQQEMVEETPKQRTRKKKE